MVIEDKLVSVIIPTYNRVHSLMKSINSVLNQTYSNFEIIIVDDASDDHTDEFVKQISDYRIKYIKHEKNMGGCVARNTGILNSSGKYIAFQDSDDEWHCDKLQYELNALIHNDADIVFCKMNKYLSNKFTEIVAEEYKEGFLNPVENLLQIGTQTILGKAEIFRNNLFDPLMPRFQELELLLRLSAKYSIYCCDKVLVDYHFDDSMNSISGNPYKQIKACKLINEKYPDLYSVYPIIAIRLADSLFNTIDHCDLSMDEKKEGWHVIKEMDPHIRMHIKCIFARFDLWKVYKKIKGFT